MNTMPSRLWSKAMNEALMSLILVSIYLKKEKYDVIFIFDLFITQHACASGLRVRAER